MPIDDAGRLVAGTGWDIDRHIIAGVDHYIALRKRLERALDDGPGQVVT